VWLRLELALSVAIMPAYITTWPKRARWNLWAWWIRTLLAPRRLPLILRQGEASAGIPFLDTTQIHVKAIVDAMFA